jgi:hypothetical protein
MTDCNQTVDDRCGRWQQMMMHDGPAPTSQRPRPCSAIPLHVAAGLTSERPEFQSHSDALVCRWCHTTMSAACLPRSIRAGHQTSVSRSQSSSFKQIIDKVHELPVHTFCNPRLRRTCCHIPAEYPRDSAPDANCCRILTGKDEFITECETWLNSIQWVLRTSKPQYLLSCLPIKLDWKSFLVDELKEHSMSIQRAKHPISGHEQQKNGN